MTDFDLARTLFDYDAEGGVMTRRVAAHKGRWPVGSPVGSRNKRLGYLLTTFRKKVVYVHRLAWLWVHGEWPSGEIDHINRDRTDNRIANLRVVTGAQNRQNMGRARNNTSGVTGVWWHRQRSKWAAQIERDGEKHHLGTFDRFEDAVKAREAAKRALHPMGLS